MPAFLNEIEVEELGAETNELTNSLRRGSWPTIARLKSEEEGVVLTGLSS